MLSLAYRLPRSHLDQLLGTVTAYPLTAAFQDAWDNLPARPYKGKPTRPAYKSLAIALCAATGQPIRMFGEDDLHHTEIEAGSRMLLLTDARLDWRLPVAVRAWERHHRRGDDTSTLATLLPEPEAARQVSGYVDYSDGHVPEAPNWVFRFAEWQILRHLNGTGLRIDGRTRPLGLRLDTTGSLLAWQTGDLIRGPDGSGYGIARITAALATRPGIDDLVICFDAHLSRIARRWYKIKNLWIDHYGPSAPLLRLPVYSRYQEDTDQWTHHLPGAVPDILRICEQVAIELPDEMPEAPGSLRLQTTSDRYHPLGTGLGARFMLRLHEHISQHLPMLEPINHAPEQRITFAERIDKHLPGGLPVAAIRSSGHERLRIACLHSTPDARARMLSELGALTSTATDTLPEGETQVLSEQFEVVTHYEPGLLAHGINPDRNRQIAKLSGLQPSTGTLIAVWAETEYHPQAGPLDGDAKPHLRRLLGNRGIPCQFLRTDPPSLPKGAKATTDTEIHHAAHAGLRDLLRACGVIDYRVAQAVIKPPQYPMERDTLLIGIHARRQQTGGGEPVLVLTMTAIHATASPGAPWPVRMYDERHREWLPMGTAVAHFHAGDIGNPRFGRSEDKAAATREYAERTLAQLAEQDPGLPMVIFADAQATRSIWPGLQNQHFGADLLPADILHAQGHDIAVVRCNTRLTEIGRPVTRCDNRNRPGDPLQPAAFGRRLYQLADSAVPVWTFPGISRTYRGRFGDTGARYTRWTLPPEARTFELGRPWHSYTATEFAIVRCGSHEPTALAALSARLCEQAPSWDWRIRYPTPLHLAAAADKDHPSWRAADIDTGGEAAMDSEDDEVISDEEAADI